MGTVSRKGAKTPGDRTNGVISGKQEGTLTGSRHAIRETQRLRFVAQGFCLNHGLRGLMDCTDEMITWLVGLPGVYRPPGSWWERGGRVDAPPVAKQEGKLRRQSYCALPLCIGRASLFGPDQATRLLFKAHSLFLCKAQPLFKAGSVDFSPFNEDSSDNDFADAGSAQQRKCRDGWFMTGDWSM